MFSKIEKIKPTISISELKRVIKEDVPLAKARVNTLLIEADEYKEEEGGFWTEEKIFELKMFRWALVSLEKLNVEVGALTRAEDSFDAIQKLKRSGFFKTFRAA